MALRFTFDWDPAGAVVRAPELRATWCRFGLWVGTDCVTLAEDQATSSVRHAVSLSLYPLAEWIAFNWWPLCFDGRDDGARQRYARRNIRAAGDGFLWPDCEFVPEGELTHVRWAGSDSSDSQREGTVRYLSRGTRYVPGGEVRSALADVVEAVIGQLDEEDVADTPLHKEWRALQSLDTEEREFCRTAAKLGLDPFTEGVDLAASIGEAAASIEPSLLADFFDSAPPQRLEEATRWVQVSLNSLGSIAPHGELDEVFALDLVEEAISSAGMSPDRPPWLAGYASARALRDSLDLDPTDPFPSQVPIVSRPARPYRQFVAAGRRFGGRAAIAMVSDQENARRFAVARSLWHASVSSGSPAFLLTNHGSTSQSAGRAFAAELLAPADGIGDLLGPGAWRASLEEIETVAGRFGVSSMVVKHQIDNQLRPPYPY